MGARVMYEHTITTDWATTMHADREQGHRMVMSLWGHVDYPNPRSAMNVLWTVTSLNTVLVRSNTPLPQHPDWTHHIDTVVTTNPPPQGETVHFTLDLVAQKTPRVPAPDNHTHQALKTGADGTARPPGQGKAYRANKITVPTEELDQWATTKLERHGLNIHNSTAHTPRFVRLSRSPGGYPITTIHANATITNPNTWHTALAEGIGKGKAFGIGMIHTNKTK